MVITKEALQADRAHALTQVTVWQSRVEYVDQLLGFLALKEPEKPAATPAEKPASRTRKKSLLCPSSNHPAQN